jgi:hypothetical protein
VTIGRRISTIRDAQSFAETAPYGFIEREKDRYAARRRQTPRLLSTPFSIRTDCIRTVKVRCHPARGPDGVKQALIYAAARDIRYMAPANRRQA